MRKNAVLCKLTRLSGLEVMDALGGHLPWSCHDEDLLGVFHQLPSAVLPRGPPPIACIYGNLAAAELGEYRKEPRHCLNKNSVSITVRRHKI